MRHIALAMSQLARLDGIRSIPRWDSQGYHRFGEIARTLYESPELAQAYAKRTYAALSIFSKSPNPRDHGQFVRVACELIAMDALHYLIQERAAARSSKSD